jgi:hypothetical protein
MERESAFEDIGYKAEPVRNTRPLIDQGSHDYLVIWPTEWKLLKVLAMARRQLNEIKERHVRNPESDTATEQQDQNAA